MAFSWLQTVTVLESDTPEVVGQKVSEALRSKKVVHVVGTINPKYEVVPFFDIITDSVGKVYVTDEDYTTGKRTGKKWIEIRYDKEIPDDAAYRYSKNAQPLHTDCSYFTNPPEIMVMCCIKSAPTGGETVFIDSKDVRDLLKAQDPQLFHDISSQNFTFSKGEDSRTQPILTETKDDVLFNWNYHCISPTESAEKKEIVERFHQFLQTYILNQKDALLELKIGDGETVLWWDDYMLHGRRSFSATESNDRFLLKTSIVLNK